MEDVQGTIIDKLAATIDRKELGVDDKPLRFVYADEGLQNIILEGVDMPFAACVPISSSAVVADDGQYHERITVGVFFGDLMKESVTDYDGVENERIIDTCKKRAFLWLTSLNLRGVNSELRLIRVTTAERGYLRLDGNYTGFAVVATLEEISGVGMCEWKKVAVEGGKWGQITGDINEQTDLIELVEGAVGDSCECVNEAKKELIDAISNIDIDTTKLAKQGADTNANITDITEKLQQIIGANILHPNLQGITFADGYATDNVLDILMYDKRYIDTITSESTKPIKSYAFYGCTSLTEVNFPNATSIGGSAFYQCTRLQTVEFPNATSIGDSEFYQCTSLHTVKFPNATSIGSSVFYQCTSLRTVEFPNAASIGGYAFNQCISLHTVNIPNAASIGFYTFTNCANIIDIHMGKNITRNVNLAQASWNPTNAYLVTTNNLVPADVIAEHPKWTNRDYLLYCLREHFAANLPDRTGQTSLTITFNGTMKAHINNSPETAAAFTNKNYIIA